MSDNQPTKLPLFNGLSLSILIGLITFTFSLIFLVFTVETNSSENKMSLYFSDQTEFLKDIHGDSNNLVIVNDSIFDSYIPKQDSEVLWVKTNADFIKKEFNPKSNSYQYCFDKAKTTNDDTSFYFLQSKYIYEYVFYSSHKEKLTQYIASRDQATDAYIEKDLKSKNSKYAKLRSGEKLFFNMHPKIIIWIVLISIAIAFSFSIVPFLISEIRKYHRSFNTNTPLVKSIAVAVIVVGLSIVPLAVLASEKYDILIKPLDTTKLFSVGINQWGLHWNSIAPYFGVIFWLILVLLKFAKAEKIVDNIDDHTAFDQLVTSIKGIESKFEGQFIALAIFLAFTIFCTDLFVSTLNELILVDPTNKIFPTEFSFMNGLMHTFFLGLIYLYMNQGLRKIKSKMPLSEAQTPLFNESKKDFLTYFKLVLTMLAPVLGGAFQKLLEII